MKANEGRYDEKYTRLKSMGGFWWYFKVCWLFPLSFLTLCTFNTEKNPSWLNTHVRKIHAWLSLKASSRYISAYFASAVLIFIRITSSSSSLVALVLDDKFIFFFKARCLPSCDLNILGKQRRTIFFIPIIDARTHARSYAYDKFYLLRVATLFLIRFHHLKILIKSYFSFQNSWSLCAKWNSNI